MASKQQLIKSIINRIKVKAPKIKKTKITNPKLKKVKFSRVSKTPLDILREKLGLKKIVKNEKEKADINKAITAVVRVAPRRPPPPRPVVPPPRPPHIVIAPAPAPRQPPPPRPTRSPTPARAPTRFTTPPAQISRRLTYADATREREEKKDEPLWIDVARKRAMRKEGETEEDRRERYKKQYEESEKKRKAEERVKKSMEDSLFRSIQKRASKEPDRYTPSKYGQGTGFTIVPPVSKGKYRRI